MERSTYPVLRAPRRRGGHPEHGQVMAVIVALIGVLLLGPLAVQVLATGQMPASTRAVERQDAIEAARAGLSDYINHLQGPYAYLDYCSTGWDALNGALSSGTTYTSLSMNAVPTAVAAGDQIQLVTSTGSTQTLTVAPGAATGPTTGPTTIAVNSFTAAAPFPAGTPAFDTTSMVWASTWACPPGSGPDPGNPAFASYPDDGHWAYMDGGPSADLEAFHTSWTPPG